MTPQRPNAHPDLHQAAPPPAHPDARIDHVLEALRTATPPAGLEQRIAARLAQAAEARQSSAPQPRPLITTDIAADPSILTTILNAARSLLAVISTGARSAQWRDPRIPLAPAQIYTAATALTLLLTVTTITLVHHRTPTTTAQTHINQTTTTAALTPTSTPGLEGAGLQSRHTTPTNPPALAASTTTLVSTPCFEGAALQSRRNTPPCTAALAAERISNRPPQQPNLDTIALAETRAPSRPAPPMPLTAQEHLLLAAARAGQPIEVAELDMARAPNLRAAAEYREDARIRRYVKGLLASFAVADALSPTTSQPQEISTTAPAPQPLSSLTD
jgi:hypothetical protein